MNRPSLTGCRRFSLSPSEGERAEERGPFLRRWFGGPKHEDLRRVLTPASGSTTTMQYQIQLTNAEATPTAVIRERVPAKQLSKFVPAACGEVWSFIRSAGLPRPGRHVALYLEGGLVEVGAEVSEPFTGNDRIHYSQLPAGRVVTTTHFGPYQRLGEAHSLIRQWCATMSIGSPALAGRYTDTGSRVGTPIHQRYARMFSICLKMRRSD